MSFARTQSALTAALKLPNTPVVALHGPWGSGKTHLWNKVAAELEEAGAFTPLYLSCMAYSSIAKLKSAAIAVLLSRTSTLAKHGDTVFKILAGYINRKLPKELRLSTNLSDIQALLPGIKRALPNNTILVFDDIERAADLNIRELLGFVYFLVDQLGIRVLLILNKEKLGKKHRAWEQLREKIISIEIALQTRPEDCISIGLGQMPATRFNVFASRVRQLGITNIRSLQHMRRVYDALGAAQNLTDDHWTLLIPSIVLFTALHLNIIANAPTVDQALRPGKLFGSKKDLTEKQQQARQLLQDYKLGTPDDFENEVLVPFLRTGHLDKQALAEYVKNIHTTKRRREAESLTGDYFIRYHWDTESSKATLLASLNNIHPYLDAIDASLATKLSKTAMELGDPSQAESLIQTWIEHHTASISRSTLDEHTFDFDDELVTLHPRIQSLYKARYATLYPPLSLKEAIEHLSTNNAWGNRQSHPIENATRDQVESLLRTAEPKFRRTIFRLFEPYITRRTQGGLLSPLSAIITSVCIDIATNEPDSRLAEIIRATFDNMGIGKTLTAIKSKETTPPDLTINGISASNQNPTDSVNPGNADPQDIPQQKRDT